MKTLFFAVSLALFALTVLASATSVEAEEGQGTIYLAPDTPVSQTVCKNAQRFPFTKVDLVAPSGCDINFILTVKRTGLGADANIQEVMFLDNNQIQINGGKTLDNNHQVISDPISVPANTAQSIFIAANLAPSVSTGEEIGLDLIGVTANGPTAFIHLPLEGNKMTMNNAIAIGQVNVTAGEIEYQQPLAPGMTDKLLLSVMVHQSPEETGHYFNVQVRISGPGWTNLENVWLEEGRKGEVLSRKRNISSNGEILNIPVNYHNERGNTIEINVRANVIAGSAVPGDSVFVELLDIYAQGKTYGFGLPVTGLPIRAGHIIAPEVAIFWIRLAPETPQSQIMILNGLTYNGSIWNLESNKDITINELAVETINGSYNEIDFVSIWDERGEMIQRKLVPNNRVVFQNLELQTAAYRPRKIWIKLETSYVTPRGSATPDKRDNFTIDFDEVVAKTDAGEPVKVIGNGTPPLMFFYRSAIAVDWESIPILTGYHQTGMKFAQVKITTNDAGGTAVLKGLLFRYVSSKSCPGASFRTLRVETGYYGEQQNFDIQQGEGYFLISTHDLAVPPGISATINSYGTLPAFINQPGTFSINLAGVDWLEAPNGLLLNAGLVPGVPSPENTFTFEGSAPEEPPSEGPETPEEPTPSISIPDTTFIRSENTDTLSVPIRVNDGGIYGGELKFWCPGAKTINWVGAKAKEGFISLSSIRDDTLLVQVLSSDGSPRYGYLGQVKLVFPPGEAQFGFSWETEFDVSPGEARDSGETLIQVRYNLELTVNPGSFSLRGTTTLRTQNGVPPYQIKMPEYIHTVSQTTGVWLLGVEPALWPQGQTSVIPEVTVTDRQNAKRSISFTVTAIMGDVDIDGEITIKDVLAILKHLLGGELNNYQMVTANFDNNGEVTRWDAIAILREVLGLPPLAQLSKPVSGEVGEVDKKELEARARAALKELAGDDSPEAEILRQMIYGLLEEYGISVDVDVQESTASPQPQGFQLHQNSPNPFNPVTTISYDLAQSSIVTLKVFNPTGQEVATLVSGYQEAGNYQVTWDGTKFATGIYLYRLNINGTNYQATRRMVLVR